MDTNSHKLHVWMDVDTGVDDSVALLCAVCQEKLIIEGVSAVAGNQTLDKTFENTRNVLALAGRKDIKVYSGKDKPLIGELHPSEYYHGKNGLGDAIIDKSNAPYEKEDAIDALYNKAKQLKGELIIIATGPLTNIASLFLKYEDARHYIKKIALMGGSLKKGNVTPYAEFNIYADSKAANIVFKSGLDIVMCGLDVTEKAILNEADLKEISDHKSNCSKLFNDSVVSLFSRRSKDDPRKGVYMHDSCPMFYLVHPEWFRGEKHCINVIEEGKEIGKTVSVDGIKNVLAIFDLDIKAFSSEIKNCYIHKLP